MTPRLKETPSQTAGPYLHIGLAPFAAGTDFYGGERRHVLAGPEAEGRRIRLEGTIFDGTGAAVRDALVEIWQADARGRYDHPEDDRPGPPPDPAFRGFGRAVSDFDTGLWWFETVKPGPVPGRHGGDMAPHVSVSVFARGINVHLGTRIYFGDEAGANAADPVLRLVEPEHRRQTLIARRDGERSGMPVYRFDIRLQGENETVFLDV